MKKKHLTASLKNQSSKKSNHVGVFKKLNDALNQYILLFALLSFNILVLLILFFIISNYVFDFTDNYSTNDFLFQHLRTSYSLRRYWDTLQIFLRLK